MERNEIYESLRSFDHEGLDDDAFKTAALGLLSGEFADPDAVHAHFVERDPPLADLSGPIGPFPGSLPDEEKARADNCLRNVFEFYREQHSVGDDIDWDENPGTDHWIHDLNRFAYLLTLSRAAQATGDDAYLRKAAGLVLDWVDKNPVTRSWFWQPDKTPWDMPNGAWRSYLNIAIHCQRWATHFDELVPFWSPGELLRVLKSIHDQLGYLEQIIPTMTNNWVVIGANGILGTTLRLPELRDRDRLVDYAWKTVAAEAERQVLPDGIQFELTQGYHMCVLRLLLNSAAVSRAAGARVPEVIDAVTARMLDYTMQVITPDGRAVAFNDSDPGSGEGFRGVLEREGRARGRDDWLYVGTRGGDGTPPAVLSQAFEHGGVYVMRTGWDRDDTFLAFDGGPWGYSHQHDDRLGFVLSALGRPFLIDPGRYLYDGSNPYSRQMYLNTTRAHSTLTIDGEGQADRWFRETWQPRDKLDNTWLVTDEVQRVAGSHRLGYGENGRIPVEHRRSIMFFGPDVFLVLDRLTGEGEHDVDSRLQFYPGDVTEDGGVWHTAYDDANLAALPLMDAAFEVAVEKGLLDPTRGWYSERVNQIEPSPTLVVHARAPLPLRGAFLLVPYRGTALPALELSLHGDTVRLAVDGTERTVNFNDAMQ